MNKIKRELSFEKLMLELREQGSENIEVEFVRKKLKIIKKCVEARTVKYYEIEKYWCSY
jgi:hypothetical protein